MTTTECQTCFRPVALVSNGSRLAWAHTEDADHEPAVDDRGTALCERAVRRATVMLHALQIGGPSELMPVIMEPVVRAIQDVLRHYAEHGGDFPGFDRALDARTERLLTSMADTTEVPDCVPEDWA